MTPGHETGVLLPVSGPFVVRLAVFAALCVFATGYFDRPPRQAIDRLERSPQRMLVVIGAGLLVAAGLLSQGPHAALVLVSAATCLLTPWLFHAMLARWPRAAGTRPRGHH